MSAAEGLARRVLAGDRRAAARLISAIENGAPQAWPALAELYRHAGKAHTVGITGPPGAGKSTLVSALAREERRRGRRVGIVAVDPSSPFSGGAILGDRIRMQELSTDPGVFIRSMASRGHPGGLARATREALVVLDAMGHDVVLLETVGAGQDEVAVARQAHTTVVVEVPGMGDDVQAIKAGILEIADVFAVNKADRPGADRTAAQLSMLLSLAPSPPEWRPPITKTVATRDEGIADLADAIDRHAAFLAAGDRLARQERANAARDVLELATLALADALRASLAGAALDALTEAIARRETDPYTEARNLVARLLPTRSSTMS